ncbi:MAG: hypothetical protein ACHQ51_06390 [Elusimicrobiota bacterium]
MFWHVRHAAGLISFLVVWLYGVYPLIKFLVYAGWCRWGEKFLEVEAGRSALKDGAIRFLIGMAFGGAVYLLAGFLGAETVSGLYDRFGRGTVYVAVFAPIRWVEWWIMERLLARRPGGLFHAERGQLYWRAGGVLASFASDAPLFLFVSFVSAIA